jgi:ABC-type enterochelin transport system substrate-binding protein
VTELNRGKTQMKTLSVAVLIALTPTIASAGPVHHRAHHVPTLMDIAHHEGHRVPTLMDRQEYYLTREKARLDRLIIAKDGSLDKFKAWKAHHPAMTEDQRMVKMFEDIKRQELGTPFTPDQEAVIRAQVDADEAENNARSEVFDAQLKLDQAKADIAAEERAAMWAEIEARIPER